MESIGRVLASALEVSEELVWNLSDIQCNGLDSHADCQIFNDGLIELNKTLREFIHNYCDTFTNEDFKKFNTAIDHLWRLIGTLYPRFLHGQNRDYDKWKKFISGLEEITSLQMIICEESDNNKRRFAA